ncbi:hypothetical protein AB4072_06435 [Microvirga sp. 2MCAF38]|uniref:cadherin repeat domain-containing protein n=1 Tax=Microvirga sp. 2MCAF38 TaxID=3232989 RepID=UPI003F9678F3
MATETTTPTNGDDILIVRDSQVTGGTFDGLLGNDILQLSGDTTGPWALTFDFTKAARLANFETIRGSATTDYIRLTQSQLAGISTFDSGSTRYIDYVEFEGSFDLSNKTIVGQVKFKPLTSGATITVNSKDIALAISATYKGVTLITKGFTLSASEISAIHSGGVDVIKNEAGTVISTDYAPTVTGKFGPISVNSGAKMHLDGDQSTILSEDRGVRSMKIWLSNWFHKNDKLDIDTNGSVALTPTTWDERVFVSGVEIGTLSRVDWANQLNFTFNNEATPALVQELIRSVTHEYNGAYLPYGSNDVDVTITDTAWHSVEKTWTLVYKNDAPIDIILSNQQVSEAAASGSSVGTLTGIDGNEDDRVTLSLIDDAGGKFRLLGNDLVVSSKINYTKAQSHNITVRATDRGGLTLDKTFKISVIDAIDYGGALLDPSTTLIGTSGKDRLTGTDKDEILFGKLGNDTLIGGTGKDIFVFDTKPGKKNVDKIVDFTPADDSIYLAKSIFKELGKKGSMSKPVQLSKAAFWTGTKAQDASDRIIYDKKTGALYYDADGTGAIAQVKIATLSKKLKIMHKDFFII